MSVWLVANAIAIAVVSYLFARLLWPPSEVVRVRNALLYDPSSEADFTWKPPNYPADFKVERARPIDAFVEVTKALRLSQLRGDWEIALAISSHLAECAREKGPIRAELVRTYGGIRDGFGYCADFTKVFLALAHAAGIVARQWAFSFDGFGGDGHVMVEVFDRSRDRWLWLDVYNNYHAVDAATGEPLTALEFRAAMLGRAPRPLLRQNGPGRPGYTNVQKAFEYYERGAAEWYLLWGNNVVSYDNNPAVAVANAVSGSFGQAIATLLGVHPRIRIAACSENRKAVDGIQKLARHVHHLGWILFALFSLLLVQLVLELTR